jgi:Tfp pilus assembly protein PilF
MLADRNIRLYEADKMIRKAVQLEPQNGAYLDSLGWVLYKKKEYKEAKKYLEEATQSKEGQHIEILDHLDLAQRHGWIEMEAAAEGRVSRSNSILANRS